jgi:ABC-type sugar transport system permease subunit
MERRQLQVAARCLGRDPAFSALSVYPLLFSIWVSFVNYDFQIPGHAFVGLKNFKQVIADPVARWSLVSQPSCRSPVSPWNSCSASLWRLRW